MSILFNDWMNLNAALQKAQTAQSSSFQQSLLGPQVDVSQTSTTQNPNTVSPTGSSATGPNDARVRLAYLSGYSNGGGSQYPGILAPLSDTSGLMFPYTPTVQVNQEVDYMNMQMTHSNTDYHAYSRTPNVTINLTGKFTVQNQYEGKYSLAAIHFMRSVSKMNFGKKDSMKGLPPPIITLSGYGTYMFNKVRVIMKSHSYTFEEGMDMIAVKLDSGTVNLPALFTLTCSLTVQPTPAKMRDEFSLEDYRTGKLLESGWFL